MAGFDTARRELLAAQEALIEKTRALHREIDRNGESLKRSLEAVRTALDSVTNDPIDPKYGAAGNFAVALANLGYKVERIIDEARPG